MDRNAARSTESDEDTPGESTLSWGCHVCKTGMNICDGCVINPGTEFSESSFRMDIAELTTFLRDSIIFGHSETKQFLNYFDRKNKAVPDYVEVRFMKKRSDGSYWLVVETPCRRVFVICEVSELVWS